ncbi:MULTISPECIES: hypothetical protein [unclassified Agarivorans]|uniref:hypothetical protein n=1 Tax=unclassified Agarivorans TaxID=2636026 RepID=UPI003D7EC6F2
MMFINWRYPQPRRGLAGAIDKFIGPGATRAEWGLQTIIPAVAAIAALLNAWQLGAEWTWWQNIVAALIAFDVMGGIITNATSSAKRWYHRVGQGRKQHLNFIALHFLQLSLISWCFLDFDFVWIGIAGLYMMGAAWLILTTVLYLQRPMAMALYSGALLISLYVLPAALGLEWFLPMFYLKLLVSHLPQEEPYRPSDEV